VQKQIVKVCVVVLLALALFGGGWGTAYLIAKSRIDNQTAKYQAESLDLSARLTEAIRLYNLAQDSNIRLASELADAKRLASDAGGTVVSLERSTAISGEKLQVIIDDVSGLIDAIRIIDRIE